MFNSLNSLELKSLEEPRYLLEQFARAPGACLTLASFVSTNTGDVARKHIKARRRGGGAVAVCVRGRLLPSEHLGWGLPPSAGPHKASSAPHTPHRAHRHHVDRAPPALARLLHMGRQRGRPAALASAVPLSQLADGVARLFGDMGLVP